MFCSQSTNSYSAYLNTNTEYHRFLKGKLQCTLTVWCVRCPVPGCSNNSALSMNDLEYEDSLRQIIQAKVPLLSSSSADDAEWLTPIWPLFYRRMSRESKVKKCFYSYWCASDTLNALKLQCIVISKAVVTDIFMYTFIIS